MYTDLTIRILTMFLLVLAFGTITTTPVFAQTVSPQLSVTTDKNTYLPGDSVIISGRAYPVSGLPLGIQVLDPSNHPVEISQTNVNLDGTYSVTIYAGGPMWNTSGTYTVKVQRELGNTAQTSFTFTSLLVTTTGVSQVLVPNSQQTFDVSYSISGGTVNGISADPKSISLLVSINSNTDGSITLHMPRQLLDAKTNSGQDDVFIILTDGAEVKPQNEQKDDTSRTMTISFLKGDKNIQIIGTSIFSNSSPLPTQTNPNSITVSTDKPSYSSGDKISVSGTVTDQLNVPISIVIKDPSKHEVYFAQTNPNPDNTYSAQATAGGDLWISTGTYEIDVTYGDKDRTSHTFQFTGNGLAATPGFKIIHNVGIDSGDGTRSFDVQYSSPVDILTTSTNTKDKSINFVLSKSANTNYDFIIDLPKGLITSPFIAIFVDGQIITNYTIMDEGTYNMITIPSTPFTQNVSIVETQLLSTPTSTTVLAPTQQDIENINQAKSSQAIAAEVNVGNDKTETKSIDNNVSVQTTQNTPDSLGVQVSATDQTGPKIIEFNLAAKSINVDNLKDLGVVYDGKLIQPAPNIDAILHAKPTDNPSFAILVTQSGVQVLVLVPHFSTHTITITNMSKVIPVVPEFGSIVGIMMTISVIGGMIISRRFSNV